MSLVHPSVIGTLNRRFVFTYYNTFEGPGHDKEAAEFAAMVTAKAGVSSLQYGAIVTSNGTLVNSFDFGMEEVAQCMVQALEENPRYAWSSPEETRVLRLADLDPGNLQAGLAAAQLWSDLLRFDRARSILADLQRIDLTATERNRVAYQRAHIGTLQIWERDNAAIAGELLAIESPHEKLAANIALDLVALQVIKNHEGAFFTGSRLARGAEAEAIIATLEDFLAKWPDAKRAGEALFYLGIALMGAGDEDGANAAWGEHYTRFPEDRLALTSRLHHSDYEFSPYGKRVGILSGNANDPNLVQSLIEQLEAQGMKLTDEQIRELEQQVKGTVTPPAADDTQ